MDRYIGQMNGQIDEYIYEWMNRLMSDETNILMDKLDYQTDR